MSPLGRSVVTRTLEAQLNEVALQGLATSNKAGDGQGQGAAEGGQVVQQQQQQEVLHDQHVQPQKSEVLQGPFSPDQAPAEMDPVNEGSNGGPATEESPDSAAASGDFHPTLEKRKSGCHC